MRALFYIKLILACALQAMLHLAKFSLHSFKGVLCWVLAGSLCYWISLLADPVSTIFLHFCRSMFQLYRGLPSDSCTVVMKWKIA